MTPCSNDSENYDSNEHQRSNINDKYLMTHHQEQEQSKLASSRNSGARTIRCPSCGHSFQCQENAGIMKNLPGLPAGVKFDPTDQELLVHLEAKIFSDVRKIHHLIDDFIPTLEGENGICYTHPEKLPGVNRDGQVRHFFHRPSKAYTTGTRKRRKVSTDEHGNETRWHKTGKTRPVSIDGTLKGFKKILVLYTNYGRAKKPEKTKWVMHQYHLGHNEEEREGELVVSKVFYQTQPRQCGSSIKGLHSPGKRLKHVIPTGHEISLENNRNLPLVGYSFDHHGIHSSNRESPPHMIPNLVVRGDGTSFLRLASDISKRN